jgi:modification methylase
MRTKATIKTQPPLSLSACERDALPVPPDIFINRGKEDKKENDVAPLYKRPHAEPDKQIEKDFLRKLSQREIHDYAPMYLKEQPFVSYAIHQNVETQNYANLPAPQYQRLNQIIQGDCLEVMRGIPSGMINLIVTSPPYNLKNSTGNGMKDGRGGKWKNAELINGYNNHDDCMPHDEYVKWQRACLTEMFRLVSDDGAIFYNHKWRVQDGLLQDRQDIVQGFPIRQIIIWRRKGGINFNPGYFLPTYEVIYLMAKPKFKLARKANSLGDVWEIQQEMNNPHPAPFPVALIDRIIRSTNAQIVLDPFIGSGTTAIAALMNGRRYLGIEKSARYVQMAQERICSYMRETFNFYPQSNMSL